MGIARPVSLSWRVCSSLLSVALVVGCASTDGPQAATTAGAAVKKPSYPTCIVSNVQKADRFSDTDYFQLMAGDGVASAPPQKLYERMKAAADVGESFKALYLARLLTSAAPELAGGWANRAAIAGSLGLRAEQAASASNADKPSARVAVPMEFVPGVVMGHRPVSLPDWAAAMNLLADDTAVKAGGSSVVAVRDDISGLETVQDGESKYAVAKSVALDDLLTNSFVLLNARAMSEHNTEGGKLALSIFMAALGGMNAAYGNAAQSNALAEGAGRMAGESTVVVSHWKGGTYTARTYPEGQPKDSAEKPKPAGEYQAVGIPMPLVWASGGSLRPSVTMALVKSSGDAAKVKTRRFLQAPAGDAEKMTIPSLLYPRLAVLCHTGAQAECTVPLSAMELMLRSDDVRALVADPVAAERVVSTGFRFDEWDQLYASKEVITVQSATMNGSSLLGYDRSGFCYQVSEAPDRWFASAGQAH